LDYFDSGNSTRQEVRLENFIPTYYSGVSSLRFNNE